MLAYICKDKVLSQLCRYSFYAAHHAFVLHKRSMGLLEVGIQLTAAWRCSSIVMEGILFSLGQFKVMTISMLCCLYQDYFGSYLPAGDGTFSFKEGPLLRAVKCGHWVLIDELNLAEAAVLSALCPLLEGAKELAVPGEFSSTLAPWQKW